jgi:hypothetical protein
LGGNVHTVKENAEALVVASKEIGLEVNADKTKYMVMSGDRNAGRDDSMKTDNNSIERVEEFKYLGTTLTVESSTIFLNIAICRSTHRATSQKT